MIDTENIAFEFAAQHILALAKNSEKYQDGYTQTCWELWKARASLNGKAASDVMAERQRQIRNEGWTPKHDDEHRHGEMARAAATYALYDLGVPGGMQVHTIGGTLWPWDFSWLKPADNRRNLVKAGALILAEIERLDRQQPNTSVLDHNARQIRSTATALENASKRIKDVAEQEGNIPLEAVARALLPLGFCVVHKDALSTALNAMTVVDALETDIKDSSTDEDFEKAMKHLQDSLTGF